MFRKLIGSLIGWVVLASTLARADVCERRLANAYYNLMLVDPDRPADDPLARLDRDVLTWLHAEIEELTSRQLENFFWVLENPDYRAKVQVPPGFGNFPGVDLPGALALTEEGFVLRLGIYEITNEFARAHLLHELTHLLRILVDGDRKDVALRGIALLSRRFGFYREEIHAYRQSYRYYRRNYTAADLERLAAAPGEREALQERLLARGLIEFIEGRMMVYLDRVRDREAADLMREFFAFGAKANLLEYVRDALRLSEPQWVKARLGPPYRAFQAQIQRRPRVTTTVRRAWRRLNEKMGSGLARGGRSRRSR